MLPLAGIASLYDFWLMIFQTWVQQIKNSNMKMDKNKYAKLIETSANNLNNIVIEGEDQENIYFNTLSLVFTIIFHIHKINGTNNNLQVVNPAKLTLRPIKYLNIRYSCVGKHIFEPWITSNQVNNKTEVCCI